MYNRFDFLGRLRELFGSFTPPNLNDLGHNPTPQKRLRPASRQNHGKGESKAKRKLRAYNRKKNWGK
jgi:hypothetical protein